MSKDSILLSFPLKAPSDCKISCDPKLHFHKNLAKHVLINKTFYKEDDDEIKIDFNGETMTFSLQVKKYEASSVTKSSFRKSVNNSHCVVGGNHCCTITFEGDIAKTGQVFFIGECIKIH